MSTKTPLKNSEELTKTFAHTLDKSLEEIDELSLQRLKKGRAVVLAHSTKSIYFSAQFMRFGMVAGLLMLVAAPILWQHYNAQQISDADIEIVSQEIPPVAQELDDMDMLIAMDDIDA